MEKVSVITPCFNGEKFIHQYMKSILDQTYSNIELVFINDGSTDRTEAIIQSYKNTLEEKGITLIYLYQENQGPAAALNKGLSIFTGDFFIYPDVDDILTEDSIEKRVDFLKNHPNYDIVFSKGWLIEENQIGNRRPFEEFTKWEEGSFFEHLITGETSTGTIYMVRAKAFFKIFPERKIYENRWTQDIQLILPMAYYCKCGFIEQALFFCVIRQDSYSRAKKSYLDRIRMLDEGYETIFVKILENLDIETDKKNRYIRSVKYRFRAMNNFYVILYLWEKNIEFQEKDMVKYVLFGAGRDGEKVSKLLRENGRVVKYFVDNDQEKLGTSIDGIEVKKADILLGEKDNIKVLITTLQYQSEVKTQLLNMGLKDRLEFCYITDFFCHEVRGFLNCDHLYGAF